MIKDYQQSLMRTRRGELFVYFIGEMFEKTTATSFELLIKPNAKVLTYDF